MNGLDRAVVNRYAAGGELVSLDAERLRRRIAARARELSRKELAVLAGVARGEATEDIAAEMVLSPHTIRSHVKSAMRKLDARTRAHAVALAIASGALPPLAESRAS